MHRVNLTLGCDEIGMVIVSLYGKHTAESRKLAARIKVVRDEHKAMFGTAPLYGTVVSKRLHEKLMAE